MVELGSKASWSGPEYVPENKQLDQLLWNPDSNFTVLQKNMRELCLDSAEMQSPLLTAAGQY